MISIAYRELLSGHYCNEPYGTLANQVDTKYKAGSTDPAPLPLSRKFGAFMGTSTLLGSRAISGAVAGLEYGGSISAQIEFDTQQTQWRGLLDENAG